VTKIELRQQFKQKRQSLSTDCLQEKSQTLSRVFFEFFELNKLKYIHLFLPISRLNEINTWIIIKEIWQNYPNIVLVTAKSHLHTGEMTHYFFDANTKLLENAWGIPEPVETEQCPNELIDMVLLPLLCFDKQGARVGYGKGFYDKFLQKCRTNTLKVGLSLFEPVDRIEDITPNDVRMDFCVTTEKVFTFA
jgi:5-formyltetrahydrofolate cyclo-ligase